MSGAQPRHFLFLAFFLALSVFGSVPSSTTVPTTPATLPLVCQPRTPCRHHVFQLSFSDPVFYRLTLALAQVYFTASLYRDPTGFSPL